MLRDGPQSWRNVRALEANCDIRLEKAYLVGAIVAREGRFDRVEGHSSDQTGNSVRQLDLEQIP